MNNFENYFGKWVVRYRWWIISVTIPVVLAAASGIQFLTINNDTRAFFSKEDPQLKALEALENTYTKDQHILFAIAPKDGDVFTRETLTAVKEITEKSWKIPFSTRVDSISNFQYIRAQADELVIEDLVSNPKGFTDTDLERIKGIALSEPQLVNHLISPSGHVTGIHVRTILPGKSIQEVATTATYARNLLDAIRQTYPNLEVYLTGGVMADNAFGEASQNDLMTLVPIMFLVLVVIAGLALRSLAGTFATLIIILSSMLTGFGLAGWLGISITVASANAPTIILTLAVADSIHILTSTFQRIRLGKSKQEAVADSMRLNLRAVFLTSITTAIGFLSMNFSDAPPYRDLGNIVAMGVIAAFVYSVLFLPALMAVIPIRVETKANNATPVFFRTFVNFIINKHNLVFWTVLIVVVSSTIGILRIELNDNFIKYFDKSYDFRRATDFVVKHLTGWDIIEYSLNSGESGGIHDPEYLSTVEAFANWYRQHPKVVHVSTITDIVKRLNKNMHSDDDSYYRIPKQRDLVAQYLLLYEMILPYGLDLNNQIDIDKSSTRMIVILEALSSNELQQTDKEAQEWLMANAPESMFTHGTGQSMIWAHITERNIKKMLSASFWTLVLISGILIVAFRSFKLGVVSLVPNLTPAFTAFGIWGVISGQVGLGLSTMVSMTIGIVVDDTIHFLTNYCRGRKEQNMNSSDSVRYAFDTVGTAMWITTLVLVAGFSVLAFSAYKMNSDMGLMTALTVTVALIMDFLLLPTLLMKVKA